jgi:hypothetical protein
MIANDPGVTTAPAMPCTSLATMSHSIVGASAHPTEVVANATMPTR